MSNRMTKTSMQKPLLLAVLAISAIGGIAKADDTQRYDAIDPNPNWDLNVHSQPAARPQPAASAKLSIEEVGQLLDATYPGKNTISNNGHTYFTVNIHRGTWNYHLTMSLSPNGNVLWINAPLVMIDSPAKVSPAAMMDLLKKNTELGPLFFQINGGQKVELTEPIPNHDLTPQTFRALIEEVLTSITATEPLWAKETLMPAGGIGVSENQPAGADVPSVPTYGSQPPSRPVATPRNPLAR